MNCQQIVILLISLVIASATIAVREEEERLLVATGDLTQPSSTIIVNDFIKMHYQIDALYLIIMIEATTVGWVGIGLSATMLNTDMVIFTTQNMISNLSDTFSTGYSFPKVDAQQDWELIGSDIQDTNFKVKAKRLLDTQDAQDTALKLGQEYTFCAAWSNDRNLKMHTGQVSFKINLQNSLGAINAQIVQTGVSKQILKIHEQFLFYGWGIGVDISILFARYLKTWKYYITVHAYMFLVLDVASIILEAIIIDGNSTKLQKLDSLDNDTKNHYIIGCVVLAMVIVQHLGGVVLKYAIEGTNKQVAMIKKFHQFFGIILYILCKINVIIGADLSSMLNDSIIIILISFFFLFFAEIFKTIYNKKTLHTIFDYSYTQAQQKEEAKQRYEYTDLMRMLNQGYSVPQIIAAIPSLKWVVFNQGVYDITDFIHPGGQYIIKETVGKEVGRYLLGGLPLEGYNLPPYQHSSAAIKLLKQNLIGFLNYGDTNIFEIEAEQKQSEEINTTKLRLFTPFQIVHIQQLSETSSKFSFQSNHQIKIKNVLKGINWIGRHFQVKIENQSKSRLYTQLNSMTDDNVKLRQSLIQYAIDTFNGKMPTLIQTKQFNKYSSVLPLIIKKYNFAGALSKTIHEENQDKQYSIQGPLGIGLDFGDHSQNQKIAIMCAGTGLLPFIDLFDFLLKKQLQESLPNHKKQLDPFNLNYHRYFKGCQFTVYSSFASMDDFLGYEWISYLHMLSKQSENNLFNLYVKLSKGSVPQGVSQIKEKQFGKFISNNIDDSMFDKIYICGPPTMFTQVIASLKKKGIDSNKIFNV